MKIAFLFKRDSHFKAVKSTALRVCVQYNCEPVFIGIDSVFSPSNEAYSVIHIDKQDLTSLSEYDYVIACLGGYLLNQVVFALRDTDTKVISIFPGIVSHYQLDAFISRLNADQVWLNSKADFELYNKICKLFKHPNNSILYGMSWLNLENVINSKSVSETSEAIFFEQTEIFSTIKSKTQLEKTLVKLIISNPKTLFKYKIRDNTSDEYFINLRLYLSNFRNVIVLEKISELDVLKTSYYLSVSSSALVEGIAYGKRSCIINQKLLDFDSKEFYKNSNLLMKSYKLESSVPVNINWCQQRILLPIKKVDLLSINKIYNLIRIHKRSINTIIFLLLKLYILNPTGLILLFNKIRLKAIQKSLEYLDSR